MKCARRWWAASTCTTFSRRSARALALGHSQRQIEAGNRESGAGSRALPANRPGPAISRGGRLCPYRRRPSEPDYYRARAQSQGPHYHRVWRGWRPRPNQKTPDGRSGRIAKRPRRADERQSAQRGSAADYQRRGGGIAESECEVSGRAGPRKGAGNCFGRGAGGRHRAAGGQRSRDDAGVEGPHASNSTTGKRRGECCAARDFRSSRQGASEAIRR